MTASTMALRKSHVDARRVLGRELHVVGVAARLRDGGDGARQTLLARDVQLLLQVEIRCRNEGVNARPLGALQRVAGALDVFRAAARERRDDRTPHGGGDLLHAFGVVQRRNREAGFDQVHAERVELPGELDLLARAQRKAGRLLAVAQSRVEDGHSVAGHIHGCTALGLNRQIYINEFVITIVYSRPAWNLAELRVFLTVAAERSFSRAATKLHRTQPAVSQAIRRLEEEVGERLFDRSSKDGTLTEAGRVLRDYAERLQRLSEEAQLSVRELRDLQRGRVLIGSNEGGVHVLLPLIEKFREKHPRILVDVRRVPARQVGVEVAQGSLDFGIVTFDPGDKRLLAVTLGPDELVLLVYPSHPFAQRDTVPMSEFAHETVIAHSDPSPARDQVLRQAEVRHAPINIQIALPSLEGIKRAVEKKMGVALLPRRCAIAEIERKQLVAVKIPEVRYPRQLRLLYRKGELSHAAAAFLEDEAQQKDE